MLRARLVGVKTPAWCGLLVGAVCLIAGCYWSRYPELMETHLVLLGQYGDKLAFLADHGQDVPVEEWGEFVYPLDRARDFARIAGRRYPDRASLRAFHAVLDRYAAIVEDPAYLGQPDAAEELARRRAALAKAIAATRVELDRETHA